MISLKHLRLLLKSYLLLICSSMIGNLQQNNIITDLKNADDKDEFIKYVLKTDT